MTLISDVYKRQADEYINHVEKYGRWKDAAVMLEGEGVRTMTALFLQMWSIQREPAFAQFLTRPLPEMCIRDRGRAQNEFPPEMTIMN